MLVSHTPAMLLALLVACQSPAHGPHVLANPKEVLHHAWRQGTLATPGWLDWLTAVCRRDVLLCSAGHH